MFSALSLAMHMARRASLVDRRRVWVHLPSSSAPLAMGTRAKITSCWRHWLYRKAERSTAGSEACRSS